MSDSVPGERVAAECPACASGGPTAHEVLNSGGLATVRCTECGHVHKTELADESTVERRVVVSQGGESTTASVELAPDDRLAVGDEFLVETDEAILTARVTSLEATGDVDNGDGDRDEGDDGGDVRRAESARVADVQTVWARAVGNVAVDLTLHPKEGAGRHNDTRSVELRVPGDERFVVGERGEYGGEQFRVERILLRGDAAGYEFEKLEHAGDGALAKDIKRMYARDETTSAWSAW